jgi:hypothetical protein
MPQPNYTDKRIKHIFKLLHDQFIYLTHAEMKSFTGSYWHHLEKNFADCLQDSSRLLAQTESSDCGRTPR